MAKKPIVDNPIQQALSVGQEFVNYFKSEFPIFDADLKRALHSRLDDFSELHPFIRGPLVQVKSKSAVGKQVALHPKLKERMKWTPYAHQQLAWEASIVRKENIVLTTPTGSGKTESALVPMIHHLLSSPNRKGLMALLVYPMNALLEDQYRRLVSKVGNDEPLLDPSWNITCEIINGNTPYEKKEQILSTPPNILVTNFKMLEVLMLRGEFKKILDHSPNSLQFLFYDELHTYMGTKGAEVAWLNRRLKLMANIPDGKLLCAAASATAQADAEGKSNVADFASRFFGEPFQPKNIISFQFEEPERDRPIEFTPTDEMKVESFENKLRTIFRDAKLLSDAVDEWIADAARKGQTKADGWSELVRRFDEYFALPNRNLEVRAHAFFRGHALVSHDIKNTGYDFSSGIDSGYPLALCRECGAHGFLGIEADRNGSKILIPALHGSYQENPSTVWITPLNVEGYSKAERVSLVPEGHTYKILESKAKKLEKSDNSNSYYRLRVTVSKEKNTVTGFTICPHCRKTHSRGEQIRPMYSGTSTNMGILMAGALRSTQNKERRRIIAFADSRQDVALQAGHTNYRNYQFKALGLFWRYLSECKKLPFDFDFADFAKFVLKLCNDSHRSAWGLLASPHRQLQNFEALMKGTLFLKQGGEKFADMRKDVKELVYESFSAEAEEPSSIEAAGLVSIDYLPSQSKTLVNLSKKLAKDIKVEDTSIAYSILRYSLDSIRCAMPPLKYLKEKKSTSTSTLGFALLSRETVDQQGAYFVFLPSQRDESAYDNRLTRYVRKLIPNSKDWKFDQWKEFGESLCKILLSENLISEDGTGIYGINPACIEFCSEAAVVLCGLCNHTRSLPAHEQELFSEPCSAYYCASGHYNSFSTQALKTKYYRQRYIDGSNLIHMHAAEHSGWIEADDRQRIEASFNNPSADEADVNIIVATPTLEMGVDLRATPVVAFRNVPPLPANYQQRAGRAGRDTKAALSLVHTRSNPYDLYYFHQPELIVNGKVHNLVMPLANAKIFERHLHAYILELAGSEIVSKLRLWKHLVFRDSLDDRVDFFKKPELEVADEYFLKPLKEVLNTHKKQIDQFVELTKPIQDLEYKFDPAVTINNFRQFFESWCNDYSYWVDQFIQERDKGRYGSPTRGERLALFSLRRAIGFKVTGANGEGKFENWVPLMALAEHGVLPRYEFPGDLINLTLLQADGGDREPIKEDVFRAIYDWAPGKDKQLYARGERFQPKFFKPASADTRPIWLSSDRERFIFDETDVSSVGGDMKDYKALTPHSVTAVDVGKIRADSEERRRGRIKRKTFYDDSVSEEIALASDVASVFLNLKSPVTLHQIVEPVTGDGYDWCRNCHVLLEPRLGGTRQQSAQEASEKEHDQNCRDTRKTDQLVSGVVLHAERENVPVIEIFIEKPSLLERDDLGSPARSLLEALLLAGRELLQLGPRGEGLDGDVVYRGKEVVVVYDPVPGGAGTIKQLWERLDEWFRTAKKHLSACACIRACDKCLLSYSNGLYHQELNRHSALKILNEIVKEKNTWSVRVNDGPKDVQYDSLSGPESLFARRATSLGLTRDDLISQHKLVEGRNFTADYVTNDGHLIFIDGKTIHNKLVQIPEDYKIRNLMTLLGRKWIALSDRHMKEHFNRIPAVLKWCGLNFEQSLVADVFKPDLSGVFNSANLEPQAVGELTEWVANNMQVSNAISVTLPKFKWSFLSQDVSKKSFGELARDVEGGYSLIYRFGISGDFHEFTDLICQRVLMGYKPLLLNFGEEDHVKLMRFWNRTVRKV